MLASAEWPRYLYYAAVRKCILNYRHIRCLPRYIISEPSTSAGRCKSTQKQQYGEPHSEPAVKAAKQQTLCVHMCQGIRNQVQFGGEVGLNINARMGTLGATGDLEMFLPKRGCGCRDIPWKTVKKRRVYRHGCIRSTIASIRAKAFHMIGLFTSQPGYSNIFSYERSMCFLPLAISLGAQ